MLCKTCVYERSRRGEGRALHWDVVLCCFGLTGRFWEVGSFKLGGNSFRPELIRLGTCSLLLRLI